ncbi:MAG: tRNA (adenosine(37)-N6)-threonylcarbamoyltransferase complex transferase subunit TsaD [Treponemataceae bacterium]|nr:MAG: tRNA (adenosine(37)-N6)-threonylcarbamoyltransferase complex transferase subunit TsaD [Treponemataceae bacterium]
MPRLVQRGEEKMRILGIETSCDETAAAIVEDGKTILSNVVATQIPFHASFSGVVPEIASRKHIEWISGVVQKAAADAHLSLQDIDAVAVSNKPGLMGALLVGLTFAKTLAWSLEKPFIAVNHMLGHLYAVNLVDMGDREKPENEASAAACGHAGAVPAYPYLGLLVSGGHTIICKVNDFDDVQVLGTTIDDAVGEAFDKVAKFYGLGYPGGPAIDALAKNGDIRSANFPLPKLDKGNRHYDVSYSGLKTAVINQINQFWCDGYEKTNENIAASFQEAAVKTLLRALFRAVDDTGIKTVVAGGGAAANSRLRSLLAERRDITAIFPPLKLCTDNGAMIAGVGYKFLQRGDRSQWDENAFARVTEFKRGLYA